MLGTSQWGFTCLCGLILINLRQLQWQTLLWNHVGHVVLIVNGEWLTPIALAREDGIAQTVVDLYPTQSLLSDKLLGGSYGLFDSQTVEAELIAG